MSLRDEYGGLIQQYMQQIIENRRDLHYLLDQLVPEDYINFNMTIGLSVISEQDY